MCLKKTYVYTTPIWTEFEQYTNIDRIYSNIKLIILTLMLTPNTYRDMPKIKSQPLVCSLRLIAQERVNVQLRTQRRIAKLLPQTDKTVDQGTQTDVPMREVLVEEKEWHVCLNLFCFCLLLLCTNLLYFQWLYLNKF